MQLTCDHCHDLIKGRVFPGPAKRKYCDQDHHDMHEDMLDRMARRRDDFHRQLELRLDHVGAHDE